MPLSPETEAVTFAFFIGFFDAVSDLFTGRVAKNRLKMTPQGTQKYLQHRKPQEWHSIADAEASFAALYIA
jgi:hypothetical protein